MTDGDYYASYANCRAALNNPNLGLANNSMIDDDALDLALLLSQSLIHLIFYQNDTTTMLTGTYANICKIIQTDLVSMTILRNRHFLENNLTSGGEAISFFQIQPALTRAHKELIKMMRDIIYPNTGMIFDQKSGEEINVVR